MKNLFSIWIIIIALLSCSKEKEASNTCTLGTITYDKGTWAQHTDSAVYTGSNLTELKYNRSQVDFTYQQDRLVRADYDQGEFIIDYTYDGSGLLAEEKWLLRLDPGNYELDRKYTYHYTNGLVTEIRNFDLGTSYTGKRVFTWKDGNVIRMEERGPNEELGCFYEFTYDLSKPNTFSTAFRDYYLQDQRQDLIFYREALFLSKNILSEVNYQCRVPMTDTLNYTYTAQGLIQEILLNGMSKWLFTYRCP